MEPCNHRIATLIVREDYHDYECIVHAGAPETTWSKSASFCEGFKFCPDCGALVEEASLELERQYAAHNARLRAEEDAAEKARESAPSEPVPPGSGLGSYLSRNAVANLDGMFTTPTTT